jgi:hypothetical protein
MTAYTVKVSIESVSGDDIGLTSAMINEFDTRRGGEKHLYNKNVLNLDQREMRFVISELNEFVDLRFFVGLDDVKTEG